MSMPSDRSIRPASHHEAKLLSELACRSKAYWGYSKHFMQACREELTLSPTYIKKHTTFVIAAGQRIKGFYALEQLSPDEIELGYLFVDPSSIRSGYGRKLMVHALRMARKLGYRRMVIQGDPNAEPFYRAFGATFAGTKPSASIPGRELPVFHLELGGLN